jgi:adenosine deaminase CECR1
MRLPPSSLRAVLKSLLPALLLAACLPACAVEAWFEKWKAQATPLQLYTLLYALPKGGDLHNHLGGAGRSEWWWTSALAQERRGYVYYTKVRIQNCRGYGTDEHGAAPYLLLFRNIAAADYAALDACEKSEYRRLQDLTPQEHEAWLASVRLTHPYDGREEFFEAQWRRIDALQRNPFIMNDILLANMEAFGREGLAYLETQAGLDGRLKPDGSAYTPAEVADLYRGLLASKEAKATGVEVRFQANLTRFAPDAEQRLRSIYALVDRYRDLYVGVNFVGREDNGKGYPLRFLPVLRELRRHYADIHLSIHAGETDEPDHHVRDSLLLGAERIGHGVNLISDPDTLVLMRHGPYLVEINLISNLLLQYVPSFQAHPFPEYLRTGIPVALSTDDRGMWDSNLTDEYFVAVREFNLSWEELVQLGRSSLVHSFLDETTKQRLLGDYERRVAAFEQAFRQHGLAALQDVKPVSYSFTCRHYQLCLTPPGDAR